MPNSAESTHRLQRLDQQRQPIMLRSILLMAGFCLMLVSLHAWSLWASRQGELQETAVSTANMARALASHAERSLNTADAVLAELVERAREDGPGRLDGERMHARMEQITRSSA